ncbi:hypothetical protein QR98_0054350 [Sarcoptes scabiei]|uniref:Uncharacterized protein n=1 Tax=Sarcoptes scabiei TaxID=52283 RepID=A0A132A7K4_SARSC|nr:hypothetical protein QR98_0054350 [Sarcoptes scabiei]
MVSGNNHLVNNNANNQANNIAHNISGNYMINDGINKSLTNRINNLNMTTLTNKDVSLMTQMNACADDLSLKPNTTDVDNKRNITQYCVSNMWEKSVANDENECQDDNEECDEPKAGENASSNHQSQERIKSINYSVRNDDDDDDGNNKNHRGEKFNIYQNKTSKPFRNLSNNRVESDGLRKLHRDAMIESKNDFYSNNRKIPDDQNEIDPLLENEGSVPKQSAMSSIKPSNTYPIIKDLNKLKSMSLPSMVVGLNSDEKNAELEFNVDQFNKSDHKKFDGDDDGDNNNVGGGCSSNENYRNNFLGYNHRTTSSPYSKNYFDGRGIHRNNCNSNDVTVDFVYYTKNYRNNILKNEPAPITFRRKNSAQNFFSDDEDESESYSNPNDVPIINVVGTKLPPSFKSILRNRDEVPNVIDVNKNEKFKSNEKRESIENRPEIPSSSYSSSDVANNLAKYSYAINGNIVSRANIIVKQPDNLDKSCDPPNQSGSSASSSYYYYYTTTTETDNMGRNSENPLTRLMTNGNGSSASSISRQRTSASNTSRISNNLQLNLDNVQHSDSPSKMKIIVRKPILDCSNRNNENEYGTPMSQSSSETSSSSQEQEIALCNESSLCDSDKLRANHGPQKVPMDSLRYQTRNKYLNNNNNPPQQSDSGSNDNSIRDINVPVTPPGTPPPLVEVVSGKKMLYN